MKTIQVLKNKLTKMTVSKSNVHLITTTSFERKKKNPRKRLRWTVKRTTMPLY